MSANELGEKAYWGLSDLAIVLGVKYNSARTYHGRSEINRKHSERPHSSCDECRSGHHGPKPGDLPAPDDHFGKSPVWRPSTIQAWLDHRPGRGAGGGRRVA